MTDLTEQYKKGELPDGKYYMENTSGIIGMVGHSKVFPCYNVKQILAPVPSYNEWKQLKIENKQLEKFCEEFNALNVSKENQRLKELLKECELWFTGIVGNMNDKNVGEHNRNLPIGNFEYAFKVFYQKINQALGEDK